MTTCCAYRAPNGEVWIGSDSLWSGGNYASLITASKIVRAGKWAMAFASDALIPFTVRRRTAQVAEIEFADEVADWLVALYVELKLKPHEEVGSALYYSAECILASSQGVWELQSDGFVSIPEIGFVAIGAGQHHAHGAAHALIGDPDNHFADLSPRLIVRRSIEIACEFDLHSAPPVIVERVE